MSKNTKRCGQTCETTQPIYGRRPDPDGPRRLYLFGLGRRRVLPARSAPSEPVEPKCGVIGSSPYSSVNQLTERELMEELDQMRLVAGHLLERLAAAVQPARSKPREDTVELLKMIHEMKA